MMLTAEATNFDAVLLEVFGHSQPSELTSKETHQAYELLKAEIPTDYSSREYEQEIQRIANYLEV